MDLPVPRKVHTLQTKRQAVLRARALPILLWRGQVLGSSRRAGAEEGVCFGEIPQGEGVTGTYCLLGERLAFRPERTPKEPDLKKCRVCRTFRPLKDFHKDRCAPLGVRAECKVCRNGLRLGKPRRYR